jgi:hypothetical protein
MVPLLQLQPWLLLRLPQWSVCTSDLALADQSVCENGKRKRPQSRNLPLTRTALEWKTCTIADSPLLPGITVAAHLKLVELRTSVALMRTTTRLKQLTTHTILHRLNCHPCRRRRDLSTISCLLYQRLRNIQWKNVSVSDYRTERNSMHLLHQLRRVSPSELRGRWKSMKIMMMREMRTRKEGLSQRRAQDPDRLEEMGRLHRPVRAQAAILMGPE